MDNNSNSGLGARLGLILSMTIFGTIGLFVKWIPVPSSILACLRGFIGAAFLMVFMLLTGKRINATEVKNNLLLLILSGAAIGFNWVLLFESYKNTTVAVATLCYYMEPVIVILASPFFFKEKLGRKKSFCCLIALAGMVLVSGILSSDKGAGANPVKGMLLGLSAAVLYSAAVIMNKFMKSISAYTKTSIQLSVAALILVPYIAFTQDNPIAAVTSNSAKVLLLLFVVGIVHTGIAYALYFGCMEGLPAQTIAIFSYIDPVVAILISTFVLKEGMDVISLIGAVMILGATAASEVSLKRKTGK